MGLFSDIMESVFGDAGMEEPTDLFHDQAAVADLLPYRLYNPENQLFYNEKTTGFIVEIPPLVSTEEAVGNLHSALVSNMPTRASYQVVGSGALKWVPIIKIVFETLYYGALGK